MCVFQNFVAQKPSIVDTVDCVQNYTGHLQKIERVGFNTSGMKQT